MGVIARVTVFRTDGGMMRRGIFALLGGMATTLMLAGCGDNSDTLGRSFDYRYKLTAEVETPTGVKTGSSVIEIVVGMSGTIMPAGMRGGSAHVRQGEAVAVDVAPGQTLFVLLRSTSNPDWATTAAVEAVGIPHDSAPGADFDIEGYYAALKADRRVWPVKRQQADHPGPNPPYLVRFKDISDPKSVEQVDPDDLAKSFGPGVKLRSLTVQVTDEPVTTGIEKRLRWLANVGPLIDAGSIAKPPIGTPYPFAVTISSTDFLKGGSE